MVTSVKKNGLRAPQIMRLQNTRVQKLTDNIMVHLLYTVSYLEFALCDAFANPCSFFVCVCHVACFWLFCIFCVLSVSISVVLLVFTCIVYVFHSCLCS